MHKLIAGFLFIFICGCASHKEKEVPVISFLDAFEDGTIAKAKAGFFEALKANGFSEEQHTIKVIYRNAQGDIPTLTQACDYFIFENTSLIATNTTLATIAAVQKTKDIPIFMMVAPSPQLAKLTDAKGKAPANLFGVYETLEYIDTSVTLIKKTFPATKKIGAIYNQSEPQSLMALQHLTRQAKALNMEVTSLPANNSSETQLVVGSLLRGHIDVFFALPDNTVFASFETIDKACKKEHIPVFTSEAGLVERGALAAYGADIFQWGYQSGLQAARFLKTRSLADLKPELVKNRKKVLNVAMANYYKVDTLQYH
jgi:putative ABC transport system substrate-binding protein